MQQSVLGERNVGLSTVVSDKTGNCATPRCWWLVRRGQPVADGVPER